MNGWTRHESPQPKRRTTVRMGHGTMTEKKPIEEFGLAFDESLGVFLPESAIRERRKVKIGFARET